ncbi:MAG TPA: hypothetical protein VGD43_11280 [Micromonospora sp.]
MTGFPVARLPVWPAGGGSTETLARDIADWVNSAALAALLHAFGSAMPGGDTGARLAYLDDFSIVWDSRGGGERLDARYAERDEPTCQLIAAAVSALGLAGREQPAADRYDHVLILGGGPVTGRARSRFAADLLDGGVTTGTVAGLGSLRPLPSTSAIEGVELTEGDGMLIAVREAFPPSGDVTGRSGTTEAGHSWWVKSYPSTGGQVSVIAAPPTRPGLRANTADTMLGWAELAARPTPDERVLVVTTDLYVPFQHADAIMTLGLPYRCGIETVGFSTRTFHAWPKGPSHTGELLQELRSAIRSMRSLYTAAQRVAG